MTEKDIKTTKQIHAFKGYATTYNVEILKFFKPESAIKYVLWDLLTQSKSFTVAIAIVLVFKKIECRCKKKYHTFYWHSKVEIIINESGIDGVLKSIYTTIVSNIQKSLAKGSCWTIDSDIDHNLVFQSIII